MQLDVFNGNIAVPIDGRIGFGIPPTGTSDQSIGPQVLASDGDPSGTIIAPVGTLALDFSTPALWQNTDGSTTWELASGGGVNIAATVVLWVDGNVTPAPTSPDGSINNPFPTISEALTAAGVPATILDQLIGYVIYVASGIYDEDLTIPSYRSVEIRAQGIVVLTDVATFTAIHDVIINQTGIAPLPGNDQIVTINGMASQNFQVTGQIVLSNGAGVTVENLEVCLLQVKVNGNGGGAPTAGVDASGFTTGTGTVKLSTDQCSIKGDSGGNSVLGGSKLEMETNTLTEFRGDLTANTYNKFINCLFDLTPTLTFLDTTGGLPNVNGSAAGFYNCGFDGTGASTYDGTALGIFLADAATIRAFTTVGGILIDATITELDDSFGVGYSAGVAGDWAVSAPTEVATALDRMASLLAVLNAAPIP